MNAEQLATAQQTLRTNDSTIKALKDRITRSQEEIDQLEKENAGLRPKVEAAEHAALQEAAKKGKK